MTIRTVHLKDGPAAGGTSVASLSTAIVDGEIYVWNGDDAPNKDQFCHAVTAMRGLPEECREKERKMIQEAYGHLHSSPLLAAEAYIGLAQEIPAWRINAWLQLFRYGVEV